MKNIIILGAGITGLWQAYTLRQRGHRITLLERTPKAFTKATSAVAGAMLAPWCEGEATEPIVQTMGWESITLWKQVYDGLSQNGTLVVAQPRDSNELKRFAAHTEHSNWVDETQISQLEPSLEGRYRKGLFYQDEAHMHPVEAMTHMLDLVEKAGVKVVFGFQGDLPDHDLVINCTGMAAKSRFKTLRGVRGELLVVQSNEITLSRPLRLLHPRFPLYIVPWSDNRFMVGATVLESEERGAVSVRSALELLGMAYALHPTFGEAELVSFTAEVRPAFPDNLPKIIRPKTITKGSTLYVNGIYRHGFLNSPALSVLVANFLETGQHPGEDYKDIFVEDHGKW